MTQTRIVTRTENGTKDPMIEIGIGIEIMNEIEVGMMAIVATGIPISKILTILNAEMGMTEVKIEIVVTTNAGEEAGDILETAIIGTVGSVITDQGVFLRVLGKFGADSLEKNLQIFKNLPFFLERSRPRSRTRSWRRLPKTHF